MAFVNERMLALAGTAVFPDIRLGRLPDLGAKQMRIRVLDYPADVRRKPFAATHDNKNNINLEKTIDKNTK